MSDEWPDDPKQKLKIEKILPMFTYYEKKLKYKGMICVPRKCVSTVLDIAHDSRLGGHFKLTKTLSRLTKFYWRHKVRDVKRYVAGCLRCQQFKDSNQKKLTDPMSLEMPKRR